MAPSMHQALKRLRAAVDPTSFRSHLLKDDASTVVGKKDLRELLHHFDRLDAEARARHSAESQSPTFLGEPVIPPRRCFLKDTSSGESLEWVEGEEPVFPIAQVRIQNNGLVYERFMLSSFPPIISDFLRRLDGGN